jgi:hypothetical protein
MASHPLTPDHVAVITIRLPANRGGHDDAVIARVRVSADVQELDNALLWNPLGQPFSGRDALLHALGDWLDRLGLPP